MNIAMFTNTYAPGVGGIERSVEIFANAMRGMGHKVLVVAPEYQGAIESTAEVLRVPALKQFNGTPHSIVLGFPSELAEHVCAFRPDIIHSHQPFLLGDSAIRMARLMGVSVIYTHHTFMERYLHWFPFEWRVIRDVALKLPVAYANLVDHVVAPTNSVAEVMRERGVRTPITSIPTGIDAAFFAGGDRAAFRQQYAIDVDTFVLGHLGRLNAEKNLDFLASAAVQFVERDPSKRRFLLVGSGKSVTKFESLFAKRGLTQLLIYTGLLQGQATADAYAAMDAFAFTSLSDTQGLVLSEAMAAGNVIFALDATGVRDIVEHGRTGYLLPAHATALEFSAQLDKAITDSKHFSEMGKAAALAAQKVSIQACTQAMVDLYTQTIEKRAAVSGDAMTKWKKLIKQWDIELALAQGKLGCLLSEHEKS